ncbi:MAG TPA: hypothetical protein VJH23_05765 [archaeon]|nr:hypothetical protein [archaeon]
MPKRVPGRVYWKETKNSPAKRLKFHELLDIAAKGEGVIAACFENRIPAEEAIRLEAVRLERHGLSPSRARENVMNYYKPKI